MNTIEQVEIRRQQAHRRLSELEVAVRTGGELELAWHITQAARGGASLAEVRGAVKLGMKLRGTPVAGLTQCANEWVNRVFSVSGASRPTRRATVNEMSLC